MSDEAILALASAIDKLADAIKEIHRASASGSGGIHVHHHGIPTTSYQGYIPGGGAGGQMAR